ncbi:MAG: pentapeptide repeat-containing protein, partial [Chlorobiaceae bacterium]|nr:pentapeptide repeat-containing protein [Chlorobiaceae bacterium]
RIVRSDEKTDDFKPEKAGTISETKELSLNAPPSATGEKPVNPYRRKEKKATSANIWRRSSDGPVTVAYDREQFETLKSNALKWNDMRKENRQLTVKLEGAPLNRKNLAYADLNHASLAGAGFRGADLSQADLRYADLRGCDLRESKLYHADLGESDLRGANLWRANMSQSRLDGALVSGSTVLHTGKKATPELAERYSMKFEKD